MPVLVDQRVGGSSACRAGFTHQKSRNAVSWGILPDVFRHDSPQHRLHVSSESGVALVSDVSAKGVTLAGDGFVGPNAHTLAVDQSTHDILFY